MYCCMNCNTNYQLTLKHLEHILIECEKKGTAKTIIICPECHRAIITGGESDWDEFSGKPCVISFSQNIDSATYDALHSSTPLLAFVGEKVS